MLIWRLRGRVLLASLLVVVAGLCLRHFGYRLGLSFFIVKYGGSVLWGAMVCLLVRLFFIASSRCRIVMLGWTVAVVVELVRLIHTPWLDAFRETFAGALLLGKVFSFWNIVAYTIGIAIAASVESRFLPKKP